MTVRGDGNMGDIGALACWIASRFVDVWVIDESVWQGLTTAQNKIIIKALNVTLASPPAYLLPHLPNQLGYGAVLTTAADQIALHRR